MPWVENYFFLSILWRHFPAKNRLKLKIQKHTIVWNIKFYYLQASAQTDKNWKTSLKKSLFDDSWPGWNTLKFFD